VFTSEMSAIFVALIQIRARRPGRYLVMSDSISSLKALQTRRVASLVGIFNSGGLLVAKD
jgi:hypothetical protein